MRPPHQLRSSASEDGLIGRMTPQSSGPKYLPNMKMQGTGPGGRGPVQTMAGRTFSKSPSEDNLTHLVDLPKGRFYSLPASVGKQLDSTKRSYNGGRFSNSLRQFALVEGDVDRSPGPASTYPKGKGILTKANTCKSPSRS